jgi:hypothetical protein
VTLVLSLLIHKQLQRPSRDGSNPVLGWSVTAVASQNADGNEHGKEPQKRPAKHQRTLQSMHRGGSDKRSDCRCKQTNAEHNRAPLSEIRRPSCVGKPERNKQARVVRCAVEHPQPPMRWIVPLFGTLEFIRKPHS